jgi:hypothetical protein
VVKKQDVINKIVETAYEVMKKKWVLLEY